MTDDVLVDFNGHVEFVSGTQTSSTFHTLLALHVESDYVYEYGDFIYQYQYDEELGDYIYDGEGNPLLLLDELGNPVPTLDDNGDPLRELLNIRSPKLESAIAWVNTNLAPAPVPEPTGAVLALLAAAAIAGRQRSIISTGAIGKERRAPRRQA